MISEGVPNTTPLAQHILVGGLSRAADALCGLLAGGGLDQLAGRILDGRHRAGLWFVVRPFRSFGGVHGDADGDVSGSGVAAVGAAGQVRSDAFLQLGFAGVGADENGMAQLADEWEGVLAGHGDAHRWVGLLVGLGNHRHVMVAMELSVVGEFIVAPSFHDDFQRFEETGATLRIGDVVSPRSTW